jgi:hypothetical protein
LLNDLPSTRLRFNNFFNVMAGTVIVIRWGEVKRLLVPVPLLIPEEAFMRLTFYENSIPTIPQKTRIALDFYLSIKLLRGENPSALNNDGGSDLTDGSTSPLADALQALKDLFWNFQVYAPRKVFRVESETTDIIAFINHW